MIDFEGINYANICCVLDCKTEAIFIVGGESYCEKHSEVVKKVMVRE